MDKLSADESLLLTTLVNTLLCKLEMNQTHFTMFFLLGQKVVKILKFPQKFRMLVVPIFDALNTRKFKYAASAISTLVALAAIYRYNRWFSDLKTSEPSDLKYLTIKIFEKKALEKVQRYFTSNSRVLVDPHNLDVGDPKKMRQSMFGEDVITPTTPSVEEKIPFTDTIMDVKGYMIWKEWVPERNKDGINMANYCRFLEIHIEKPGLTIDGQNYLDEITRISEQQNKKSTLFFVKIFDNNKRYETHFFRGTPLGIEENEKKYMDSFFHKEKDRLWPMMKKIVCDPDFYKSRGQAPRINLLLHGPPGTGKSSFAFRIAQCFGRNIISVDISGLKSKNSLYETFFTPIVNGVHVAPSDCVFVLDEFDIAVKTLVLQDQDFNEKGVGGGQNRESDDTIHLKDLLEVFQGSFTIDGTILIATTNDYNAIKTTCPALFRPGRLTPVYFGNLCKDQVQKMVQYFFSRDMVQDNLPDEMPFQTSRLVDLAMEALTKKNPGQFDWFQIEFNKLLDA